MTPISAEEKDLFDAFLATVQGDLPGRVCAMRVRHGGTDRVVIAVAVEDGEEVFVKPVALLLDDELFAQIDPPTP